MEKRTERITIAVTPTEKEALCRVVNNMEFPPTLSVYMRQLVLNLIKAVDKNDR